MGVEISLRFSAAAIVRDCSAAYGESVKAFIAIGLVLTGAAPQPRHWVPVAIGPDRDVTGLYIDKQSVAGRFPVKTVWQRFLNSYREERLSLVEVNCARNTSRELKFVMQAPNGQVLRRGQSPKARSSAIASHSAQDKVRGAICETSKKSR